MRSKVQPKLSKTLMAVGPSTVGSRDINHQPSRRASGFGRDVSGFVIPRDILLVGSVTLHACLEGVADVLERLFDGFAARRDARKIGGNCRVESVLVFRKNPDFELIALRA